MNTMHTLENIISIELLGGSLMTVKFDDDMELTVLNNMVIAVNDYPVTPKEVPDRLRIEDEEARYLNGNLQSLRIDRNGKDVTMKIVDVDNNSIEATIKDGRSWSDTTKKEFFTLASRLLNDENYHIYAERDLFSIDVINREAGGCGHVCQKLMSFIGKI